MAMMFQCEEILTLVSAKFCPNMFITFVPTVHFFPNKWSTIFIEFVNNLQKEQKQTIMKLEMQAMSTEIACECVRASWNIFFGV
jgi:hypothetical protein